MSSQPRPVVYPPLREYNPIRDDDPMEVKKGVARHWAKEWVRMIRSGNCHDWTEASVVRSLAALLRKYHRFECIRRGVAPPKD